MQIIRNFAEARQRLQSFIGTVYAGPYELNRMRALMDYIGNPQDAQPVIHVAGTSGKTSTCYYTAAILQKNNIKVGLAVSPYIDEVNERVQVNDMPLPEHKYCAYLTEFLDLVDSSGLRPMYFEILVAFSLWVFAKEKMDIVVLEVGVGGLLDTTNVIGRPKVCAITDIGFDHTELLGDTISAIATQKAGIINNNSAVVMHQQNEDVLRIVQEKCGVNNARLTVIPLNESAEKNVVLRNWQLAGELAKTAAQKFNLGVLNIPSEPSNVTIPGRFEVWDIHGKTIIIDGAHNPQKLHRFVQTVLDSYPNRTFQAIISFGIKKTPTITQSLEELKALNAALIVSEYHLEDSAPNKALSAVKLAELAESQGLKITSVKPDLLEALQLALNDNDDSIIIVTGSLFLATNMHSLKESLAQ